MKYFTHPEGIFKIKIPLEWYYKNEVAGYENKSPFSFELFQNTQGCFQISCYHKSEQKINSNSLKGHFNNDKLEFIRTELPDDEFKILLWATLVEDYFFMAKYVCQPTKHNLNIIKGQIEKVEYSLSTLMCLSLDRRELAINYDRYEKFNASIAASFDLKNKAIKSRSFIELIIIIGNHIDACLGLAEKVFNPLFFAKGKKERGMLVLGLRPNPHLTCCNKGCFEGEALEPNSSIFSPKAKKSRINL
jgi:hypothetical protein